MEVHPLCEQLAFEEEILPVTMMHEARAGPGTNHGGFPLPSRDAMP